MDTALPPHDVRPEVAATAADADEPLPDADVRAALSAMGSRIVYAGLVAPVPRDVPDDKKLCGRFIANRELDGFRGHSGEATFAAHFAHELARTAIHAGADAANKVMAYVTGISRRQDLDSPRVRAFEHEVVFVVGA